MNQPIAATPPADLRPGSRPARRWLRWTLATLPPAAALLAALAALAGSGYVYVAPGPEAPDSLPSAGEIPADRAAVARLQRERRQLESRLRAAAPRGLYVVLDRHQNRLHLREGERLVRTMVCSAGSGKVLVEPGEGGRRWVFDTPTGAFRVLSKTTHPVWRKPDWAFLEEGEPIPDDPDDRIEYNALGEYGLYLGDGYLIHGTLYERLIGRSVTHGCVRLGRDDLRDLYRTVPVGAAVFIH